MSILAKESRGWPPEENMKKEARNTLLAVSVSEARALLQLRQTRLRDHTVEFLSTGQGATEGPDAPSACFTEWSEGAGARIRHGMNRLGEALVLLREAEQRDGEAATAAPSAQFVEACHGNLPTASLNPTEALHLWNARCHTLMQVTEALTEASEDNLPFVLSQFEQAWAHLDNCADALHQVDSAGQATAEHAKRSAGNLGI